eukprot:TRINITY_DN2285_c1_g1_i1.p1 TRINITY_DN2285_c1_g1~~TRINITY_DN2285_c1_g1_i1.p1  ORF type:complete len:134 (+),score=2.94 TRINITY_DN2285_c1_g1_i1:164-565(+)
MYDFCFTLPYGFLLAVGGLLGFLMTGSKVSLAAGGGAGVVLLLLGYVSLNEYKAGRLCKSATGSSLIISITVAFMMGNRFLTTHKIFPAAAFAVLSICMSVFYVWNLVAGPKPKPKKAPKAQQGASRAPVYES